MKRTSLPIAGVVVGALALVLVACGAITAVAQSRPASAIAAQGTPADPEAGAEPAAAVLVEGQPILWLTVGAGGYSPQFRADRIGRRLADAIHDRTLGDPKVIVAESDGSSEIRVGPRLLMVVTGRDAASLGASRPAIAQQYAAIFDEAIRAERLRYAPATLLRSTEYAVLATLAFAALAWLIVRITTALRRATARRLAARAEALQAIDPELLAPARLSRTIGSGVIAARVVLLMGAADVYLTYVLGLFPWTRAVSTQLLGYAFNPVRTVIAAFAGYVPKLLFLIVIAAFINVAIRLVGAFFRPIRAGRLVFASFPAEWADPTHKIVRVVLIAFGVVVAFPYLPASESPAFAGVSVFMGVLVSLASSSALSNMIAGLVLTYTGAFRLGDRVKVGDAFGDIIETSLLATRVRTIKNEDVTIPNSIALGSAVTNYTREASSLGLILHTTVTIGYDTPWRRIHDLLIEAALATPGILREPPPFVWQTALNDFYATYEINAYTATPKDMITIYAVLHSRIQDAFLAAGVEIMSPHFTAIRDGNTAAIPEPLRGPGYVAPRFRVEQSNPLAKI